MLQDEQREQDSLLAWFGDGLYDKTSPAPQRDAPHSCGLLAHVFLHVGETLIAISIYEFLLRLSAGNHSGSCRIAVRDGL